MGTSSAYGGPSDRTPLVPSWINSDDGSSAPAADPTAAANGQSLNQPAIPALTSAAASAGRFTAARNNLSRFASSGGTDRSRLGRAISHYVSTASGGGRAAAQRMGASRTAGARLLGFLSSAAGAGTREALRSLRLEHLAGRPIEEIFLGLTDYVCPENGTVDEGIAREAFIETIADLAANGITDIDALSPDQMQTIFELYATHAIEARLCNDIGANTITFPVDAADALKVQTQLFEFIRRSVADALTAARATMQALTPDRVLGFVSRIYAQAFGILESLAEAEVEA